MIFQGTSSLEIAQAVTQQDSARLTRVPGIGKKTAEKLCFELSERLGGLTSLNGLGTGSSPADSWESDLRSALTNLGFKEEVVLPVVAELRTTRPPLPDAIRLALKALQK